MSSPSRQDRDDAIRMVEEYVRDIGDEWHGRLEEGTEDLDPEHEIYHFDHGDSKILVGAFEGRKYLQLVYALNAVDQMAEVIEEDDPTRTFLREEAGIDLSDVEPRELSEHLVDSMPDPDIQALVFHLSRTISSPQTAYRTQSSEGGGLEGFQVVKKIFPYHDEFTLPRFEEATQAVVSIGHLGMQFLQNCMVFEMRDGEGRDSVRLRFHMPKGAIRLPESLAEGEPGEHGSGWPSSLAPES